MRKRFYPSDRLPVIAKRNSHLVKVGEKYYRYSITKRYTKDEDAEAKLVERMPKIWRKNYDENIKEMRKKIDEIFGDVYVVIPQYPDKYVSEIMLIIKQLQDEPNDIVAVEICTKLNL